METRENKISSHSQYPPKSPLISGTWRRAFTLVELIIVITILAILATIAFMSFQGYMKDSRDAVRVSDLTSASKGLSIFFTKAGVYPETESGITLTASGTPIGYQWYLWASVVRAINMNQVPLDPVDQTRYIYSTSAWKTKFQLMAYTENSNLVSVLPQSYAIDYSERGLAFQWDELGVVLNNDNSLPTINVETASGSSNFKVLFDKTTKTEWSGNLIFSQIYNMRNDLINKKELASLDDSLVAYWDMETTFQSGATLLLKDWSKYGNHGTCFNGTSSWSCWVVWPQIVNGNWKNGKMMSFDGDDWVQVLGTVQTDEMTIITKISPQILDEGWHWVVGYQSPSFERSMNLWLSPNSYTPNGWFSYRTNSIDSTQVCPWTIENSYNINNWSSSSFLLWYTRKWNNLKILSNGNKILDVSCAFSSFYTPWVIWLWKIDNYFKWTIDEVRIYNRALSDSEIKTLYQATK